MNPTPVADGTKEKLFQEFTTVISETEQLIKSVAGVGTDKAGAIKANVEQNLAAAGERLARIREDVTTQASAAARAADEYVQGNPWRSVGIVAAAAAFAGMVAGMLIARR